VTKNYNSNSKDYDDLKNANFSNYGRLVERTGTAEDGKVNHPFFFPGSNPPHINKNMGGKNDVFRALSKMRRGFMRSILFDTSGSKPNETVVGSTRTPNVRLNFQFNPEYIERNVAQSQGAVNPLLQNPANLTQPVPGTASFNFTMTFNREYEVANRDRDLRFRFRDAPANDLPLSVTDDFTTTSMLGELSDPRYSGVLHDLSIFDKIIGQGISQDVIDTITNFNAKVAEVQNSLINQGNNANQNNQFIQNTQFDEAAFRKTLSEKNFGNSAFINPLPVRIVFGDLFMVEGFVTGSAVAFQKFSHQMIPTICQVNCTVQALYFGFAKRKAFLTDSLADWYKSVVTPPSTATQQTQNQANEYLKDITYVGMLWNHSGHDYGDKAMTDDFYNLDMPVFNSDITKIIVPTNTWQGTNPQQLRYEGNLSTAAKFLTLPQWFNAFSQTQGDGLSSSTVVRDVGGGNKRTMIEMLEEKVLEGQIQNFNSNWQTATGLTSNRLLQGYTPLVVGFRIFNPKIDPAGKARNKDFPNEDFTSVFQFELTRIEIRPLARTQLTLGEIEILNIPYVDTTHWSSWYRTWRKSHKAFSLKPSSNIFKSPLHRAGIGGFNRAAPDNMTDFVKIYWVRPKYNENVFLQDDVAKGINTKYEISYYFKITVNGVAQDVSPIKQECENGSIFITNSGVGAASKNTRWTNPNFKVGK